jgi:hypothetical protein
MEAVTYNIIRASVPRELINKEFDCHRVLSPQRTAYFRRKRDELLKVFYQSQNAISIVEKILLRESSPERHRLTRPL